MHPHEVSHLLVVQLGAHLPPHKVKHALAVCFESAALDLLQPFVVCHLPATFLNVTVSTPNRPIERLSIALFSRLIAAATVLPVAVT
jgi:hypothetical protein